MENLVNYTALSFLFLAVVTLALIFRDAFRHLSADDQTTFRRWMGRKLSLKTRAIDNIWSEHARFFPNSTKRALFVLFLTAFVVVGVAINFGALLAPDKSRVATVCPLFRLPR